MIKLSNLDFYYASPKEGHKWDCVVDGIAVAPNGKILWVHDAVHSKDSIRVGKEIQKELVNNHEKFEWFKVAKDCEGSCFVDHRPKRLAKIIHI